MTKYRNPWLQAGDKNTVFFHKQAEVCQHFNFGKEITHADTLLTDFEDIKQATHENFKDIYSESFDPLDPGVEDILEHVPMKVTLENNLMLTAPVSMEEIKSALDGMNPDKAPGPDGFIAQFLTACWSIEQKDLLRLVRKS